MIFTILICVLYSSGTMWGQLKSGCYAYSAYLAMMYYVFAYLISLIVATFKRFAGILKPFFVIVFSIYFIANIFCIRTFNSAITPDIVSIVRETNFAESKEFLQTYIGIKELLFALLFGVIVWTVMKLDKIVSRSADTYIHTYIRAAVRNIHPYFVISRAMQKQ